MATTSCAASRISCDARSRTAIPASSSSAPCLFSSRRSRRRSSPRQRRRRVLALSAPGRIGPRAALLRVTSRARSSVPCGAVMGAGAPSSGGTVIDARSGPSWSSIMWCRTPSVDWRRWRTSRCDAGVTTNTRTSWSSGRAVLRKSVSMVPGRQGKRRPGRRRLAQAERGASLEARPRERERTNENARTRRHGRPCVRAPPP